MSYAFQRRRKIRKAINFTHEEWAQVQEHYRCSNQEHRYRSITDFIRTTLVYGGITQIQTLIDPRNVRRDMHNIGININQIAHVINSTRNVHGEQIRDLQIQVHQLKERFDQYEAIWQTATQTKS